MQLKDYYKLKHLQVLKMHNDKASLLSNRYTKKQVSTCVPHIITCIKMFKWDA